MAEQRFSRQELIRRRRRVGFVGRRGELSAFRENLARHPEDQAFQFLFHVRGNAGVGKTSLVRQWEQLAADQGAITAYLSDGVHSATDAMEAVSRQFGRQGSPLKGFDKLLTVHRQRRHEAEGLMAGQSGAGAEEARPASAAGTVTAQIAVAGLGMVPGLGPLAGVLDAQQVAQGAERVRAVLASRWRSQEDVQLVMTPLHVLTPVFLDDLAEVARRHSCVVLFFDTYERTGPVLDTWLRELLVTGGHGDLPVNVVVVLSGQGRLDPLCWADCTDLVAQVPLEVFTEDEARELLAVRGVTQDVHVETVLRLSGRLPVLVDTLARASPGRDGDLGDPSGTAVERFLKWEEDPHRRAAALCCALPLHLNEDVFRAAVPADAADQYGWLRGLPFVTEHSGGCRYHDVVRSAMLRLQRTRSPLQWQARHAALADVFGSWRQALEADLPAGLRWQDQGWRENRLCESYHRLCASPRTALPQALSEIVRVCDESPQSLRRWAETLLGAGQDTGSDLLTGWGRRLQAAAADDGAGTLPALTLLLGADEPTTADKALGYAVRGREHRLRRDLDSAVDDYTAALARDPRLARAHTGRGLALRQLGRYQAAMADFTRAVELEPDAAGNLVDRGISHRFTADYWDSLADLDAAVALDPLSSEAIGHRGLTNSFMNRHPEAVADFTRALALDPADDRVHTWRGQAHAAWGRVEEAVADFTRALDLAPANTWALINRAKSYAESGRHDAALADFRRAVDTDPGYVVARQWRAVAYRAMGRYPEALADLTHVVEQYPSDGWPRYELTVLCRIMALPGEDEHWRLAAESFIRAAGSDGTQGLTARGNLVVLSCATSQAEQAQEHLERLLEDPAGVWFVAALLKDLADLRALLPVDAALIGPLEQRLEAALARHTATLRGSGPG